MTSPPTLTEFLNATASAAPAPGGLTAIALGAALAVALFEKSLRFPSTGSESKAGGAIELMVPLRTRLLRLVESDQKALETLASADEAQRAGAVMGAYRSARRLLDAVIQAYTFLQQALDFSHPSRLADIEAGVRLLVAAQEGAIAQAEDTLKLLPEDMAESERPGLVRQIRQVSELAEKARGGLSWRRGKAG
ncbi:MAG TPA: cyclodeaminase/cyclohydrolase family protein [Oscillatoriaceae cyanobacterium]